MKVRYRPDKSILPDMWYIVYEKDLLNPRIFRHHCKSEYHARKLAQNRLDGKRHNVLIGSDLISFGITQWSVSINKNQGFKGEMGTVNNYGFPKALPFQRKKTLRTLYRRQVRRKLAKLLKRK